VIHTYLRARHGAVGVLLAGVSLMAFGSPATGIAVPTTVTITGATVDHIRHVVTFQFSAVGPTRAFRCGLARSGKPAPLSRCTSPLSYDKLGPGVYEFTVRAVGPGGTDSAPATATVAVPIEFSRCWGAASRDPEHRCDNPALKDVVVPTPANALLVPTGFCNSELGVQAGGISICTFGVDPGVARGTIALIGDSHSTALRPAIGYVATVEHWYGLNYEHNGCGFSEAIMLVPDGYASTCHTFSQDALAWLWQNREISTVVITGADERGWRTSSAAGFRRLWRAIPPWVSRIFIVRDIPHEVLGESDCVQRALARHQPAGILCSQPRSKVLTRDLEAAAAVHSGSPRVHLIDLTPFFCGTRRCLPVVGGALTLTDLVHMSPEFALSLGPYLERDINAVK
jgi:hypothetical protein